MPPYELVWVDYATAQFNSLPKPARRAVMATITELQDDPVGCGVYDQVTDRYTADFAGADVAGLIAYVVGQPRRRVIILRVTVLL